MTERELRDLIAGGENEHVEMTRAFDKADKMGQAMSGGWTWGKDDIWTIIGNLA